MTYPQAAAQPKTAPHSEPLSEIRKRVLEKLVPSVVPSSFGDTRFALISRGITPDSQVVLDLEMMDKKYTTCGHLIGFLGERLGGKGLITTGPTNGLRTAAEEKNAWITPDSGKLPKPGDMYALCYRGVRDFNSGISHVGVIVSTVANHWVTADAGQGNDGFSAKFVNRRYDAKRHTLSNEFLTHLDPRAPRLIAGWMDIDQFFAPPRPASTSYTCKMRF